MPVQELASHEKTKPRNQQRNAIDLAAFISRLASARSIHCGRSSTVRSPHHSHQLLGCAWAGKLATSTCKEAGLQRVLPMTYGGRTHADLRQAVVGAGDRRGREWPLYEMRRPVGLWRGGPRRASDRFPVARTGHTDPSLSFDFANSTPESGHATTHHSSLVYQGRTSMPSTTATRAAINRGLCQRQGHRDVDRGRKGSWLQGDSVHRRLSLKLFATNEPSAATSRVPSGSPRMRSKAICTAS